MANKRYKKPALSEERQELIEKVKQEEWVGNFCIRAAANKIFFTTIAQWVIGISTAALHFAMFLIGVYMIKTSGLKTYGIWVVMIAASILIGKIGLLSKGDTIIHILAAELYEHNDYHEILRKVYRNKFVNPLQDFVAFLPEIILFVFEMYIIFNSKVYSMYATIVIIISFGVGLFGAFALMVYSVNESHREVAMQLREIQRIRQRA